ncbi:MAG: efflux RND transporter periplasmic adaptor subunit [Planctomycetota bacterium]
MKTVTSPALEPRQGRSGAPSTLGATSISAILLALTLAGCRPAEPLPAPAAASGGEAEAPTNRTPVPASVRESLGISFATADYRPVASTVPLPGHFEVLPTAQHHYPVPAAGRVTVHVAPLQEVAAGELILEIDAPDWRALQLELVEARALRLGAEAGVARARAARIAAGALVPLSPDSPDVFSAELEAARATLLAAEDRLAQLLSRAATLTGLDEARLAAEEAGIPAWRRLPSIPIRATTPGVVREVEAATGTWVTAGTEVLHIVQPRALRFRARALQADLIDRIRDGQSARILPPEGRGAARRAEGIGGTVRIGVTGNPESRTTDVFIDLPEAPGPEWARPLVVAIAEVVVGGSTTPVELAIPNRALIRDGLETVFFRRAPDDPDVVIRTIADLGESDGRYTAILSGLAPGDEVVVDGVYPLKLASSAKPVTTGHFHADGTYHEEDH